MPIDRTPNRHATVVRVATVVFLLSLAGTFAVNLAAVTGIIGESTHASVHHDLESLEGAIAATVDTAGTLAEVTASDPALRAAVATQDADRVAQVVESAAARLRAEHGATDVLVTDTAGATATSHPLATIQPLPDGLEARAGAPITDPDGTGVRLGTVEVAITLDAAFLTRALPGHGAALFGLEANDGGTLTLAASTLPEELAVWELDGSWVGGLPDHDVPTRHESGRWALATRTIEDLDGVPAGVALVAADVAGLSRHATIARWNALAAVVLTIGGGSMLAFTRRMRDREIAESQRTIAFDAKLGRALQHAEREREVLEIIDEALEGIAPDRPARVLVADSSRAHLTVALSRHLPPVPGTLPTPMACPATRTGEVQRFLDSRALDACPALKRGACAPPDAGPVQARCQPLSIQGSTVGVLQTLKDVGADDEHLLQRLDVLVRRSGDRISVLRALSETRRQADTDPLTGLSNRRSFDQEVAVRLHHGVRYAVLFADLDRFKLLNDTHGHEVGDRALRVFAEVIQGAVRPDDAVGRFGGEEFVVFLSDCDRSAARDAAERVRAALDRRLATGQVPHYTVSIGVADSEQVAMPFTSEGFDAVVSAADGALLRAKAAGRNRVEVSGEPGSSVGEPVTAAAVAADPPADGGAWEGSVPATAAGVSPSTPRGSGGS